MSSGGLKGSLASWQRENADAVKRNTNVPKSSTPKPSTPTPAAAAAEKRSHDAAFQPPAATPAAAATGQQAVGQELMTRIFEAIDYLRKNAPKPLPFESILRYLSLPADQRGGKTESAIRRALQASPRAEYIPRSESGAIGKECFKYAPLVPVANAEELRDYLNRMAVESAKGLSVKDLKDGWPDCTPTIDRLERLGHLLVVRNKKDNTPKTVYPDNPSFHPPNTLIPANLSADPSDQPIGHIDQDLRDFWAKIRLPANENDIRIELERAGITPTSQVKEAKPLGGGKKEKKVRKEKKNAKKTNVHMAGILKDYSHKKPGGK